MKMELRHLEVRISLENMQPVFRDQVKILNNIGGHVNGDAVHCLFKSIAIHVFGFRSAFNCN